MNVIDALRRDQLKENVPKFRAGDTVKVYSKVVEGGKERTQMFEGVVIVRKGGSNGVIGMMGIGQNALVAKCTPGRLLSFASLTPFGP